MNSDNVNMNSTECNNNQDNVINDSNQNLENQQVEDEFFDSDMGMSIDDAEIIQLYEQEPLWDTLLNNTTSTDQENKDQESINNEPKDSPLEPLPDLEHIPDSPEFSMDDLPIFPKFLSQRILENVENSKTEPKKTQTYSRSFRQRNAIQLHPFTLEYAQYKKLLNRSKSKKQSLELDTQVSDVVDETIHSQYIPPDESSTPNESSTVVHKDERKSIPSASKKAKKKNTRVFISSETDIPETDIPELEKYGLDKLILPPLESNVKEKPKLVTFQKKRKAKHHQTLPRKHPRSTNNDIFDFDDKPKATFNFARNEAGPSDMNLDDMQLSQNFNNSMNISDSESDGEEMDALNFRRRKYKNKSTLLDDSSEEDEKGDATEETDSVFDFPRNLKSKYQSYRRLVRKITDDDDIVPIVEDEMEFKDRRHHQPKLKDILKKKTALRNVLPASFTKIYGQEILEEQRPKIQKKRTKPTKPVTSQNTTNTNDSHNLKPPEYNLESNREQYNDNIYAYIFAKYSNPINIFDDLDDDNNSTVEDDPDIISMESDNSIEEIDPIENDSNVITSNPINNKNNVVKIGPMENNRNVIEIDPTENNSNIIDIHPIENDIEEATYQSTTSKQVQSKNSNQNKSVHNQNNIQKSTIRKSSSRMNIPKNKHYKQTGIDNYVSNELYIPQRNSDHQSNEPSTTTNKAKNKKHKLSRKQYNGVAYDKIISEYSIKEGRMQKFTDNKGQQVRDHSAITMVYSLDFVARRIRHLRDRDFQHVHFLENTVYLHKQLLTPLLSAYPTQKLAYEQYKDVYKELILFNSHLLWTNIVAKESGLISSLFYHLSKDIQSTFSQWKITNEDIELPEHDHFYTFVSICLTQWIPRLPEKDRTLLTQLFLVHIRNLAWMLSKLIFEKSPIEIPWRITMKLLIFILDWTCRLYHLNVNQVEWCVADHTQLLMDILVYIGYEDIELSYKPYFFEAWISLIQLMSVGHKNNYYGFNERVFIHQLKNSIEQKYENTEIETKKRLWAKSLNFILDKFFSAIK